MLAYTVGVASAGALHVEPMLQYFDGLVRGQRRASPAATRVLPPQRLPPRLPPQPR